jgi:ribosomal protein S18 acetylase RimI-like enzyme
MRIRSLRPQDTKAARLLLIETGFARKAASVELFEQSIAASQIALVAEIDGMVVGFARAITDGIFNGYISSVAVSPSYQGRGIGTALINELVGQSPDITWILRAGRPGVTEFYKKLGFKISTVAMEKLRQP